jgi:hypothetical protein
VLDLLVRVQGVGDVEDDAGVPALLPHVLPRRLAEAERVVPGLQELAAADPAVHAALGGRSALAVRRGSEAEEVIRFVGFSFFFLGFGFFSLSLSLSSWVVGGLGFCRLVCLFFGCHGKNVYFWIGRYWGLCFTELWFVFDEIRAERVS